MKIRHPVLLVILIIIGVGMLNSLFREPPAPRDPKVIEQELKEMAEKRKFNEEHCRGKGLIYYAETSYSKGECITLAELGKISAENAKKMKEMEKSRANEGLR